MKKTPRFEAYVRERVQDMTAAKREKLAQKLTEEERLVEDVKRRYKKMLEKAWRDAVGKVADAADKNGDPIDKSWLLEFMTPHDIERITTNAFGVKTTFDYDTRRTVWAEGTEVRRAQDALAKFDEDVEKAVRRIVVYKMDLGLKPDAFEKLLEETVEKLF